MFLSSYVLMGQGLPYKPQVKTTLAWTLNCTASLSGTAGQNTPTMTRPPTSPFRQSPLALWVPLPPAPHTHQHEAPAYRTALLQPAPPWASRTHPLPLCQRAKPCDLSFGGKDGGRQTSRAPSHSGSRYDWREHADGEPPSRTAGAGGADGASLGGDILGIPDRVGASECCPNSGWVHARLCTPDNSGPGLGEADMPGWDATAQQADFPPPCLYGPCHLTWADHLCARDKLLVCVYLLKRYILNYIEYNHVCNKKVCYLQPKTSLDFKRRLLNYMLCCPILFLTKHSVLINNVCAQLQSNRACNKNTKKDRSIH